jgi:hypothetical protein
MRRSMRLQLGLIEVSEEMEKRCSIGRRGAGGELEFWAGMFGLFAAAVVGLANQVCCGLIGQLAGIDRLHWQSRHRSRHLENVAM